MTGKPHHGFFVQFDFDLLRKNFYELSLFYNSIGAHQEVEMRKKIRRGYKNCNWGEWGNRDR